MISQLDAKNILVLLERVNLSAKEVDVYTTVRNKLRNIANPPPATAEQDATPPPESPDAETV